MKSFHLAAPFVYSVVVLGCNSEFGCGDDSYTKLPDGKSTYGFDDGGCFFCAEPGLTPPTPMAGGSLSDHCKRMCDADVQCVAYTVGRPAVMSAHKYYYGKIANCCLEHRHYPAQAFVDATKEKVVNNTCQLDASCWTRYEKNEDIGRESDRLDRSKKLSSIKPTADTYIRDGDSHSATNYGSQLELPIKTASVGWTRIALLQFSSNVSALSQGRRTKVRLFIVAVDRDLSRTISVARIETFTLNEKMTTWQNTPLHRAIFGSSNIIVAPDQMNQWVEIDITDLLVDRDDLVLAFINDGGRTSSGNLVTFASRETVNGPRIVFEDYAAPPTPTPSDMCSAVWDEATYSEEEVQTKLKFIEGGCDYGDETFRSMLVEAHGQCLVEVIAESISVTIVDRPNAMYTYVNVLS